MNNIIFTLNDVRHAYVVSLLEQQLSVLEYLSSPPVFCLLVLSWVRVTPSLVFCGVFYKSLFVFVQSIVSLRFKTSGYSFCIFLQILSDLRNICFLLNVNFVLMSASFYVKTIITKSEFSRNRVLDFL